MNDTSPSDARVRTLREEFDRSFARLAEGAGSAGVDYLAIRVAGDPYALRLSEVASLHADRKLVPAPSLLPELLGLAGFRGELTPVYDLAALLGYSAEPVAKWLVLARSAAPIGFAFQSFDSHERVLSERDAGVAVDAKAAVQGAIQSRAGTLPLLQLPALIEAISSRIKAHGPSQER